MKIVIQVMKVIVLIFKINESELTHQDKDSQSYQIYSSHQNNLTDDQNNEDKMENLDSIQKQELIMMDDISQISKK